MFNHYNEKGKLVDNISLSQVFRYFKDNNVDNNIQYANKKIAVNRQLLKHKEQLVHEKYNYTAFIEKVNLLNTYMVNKLKDLGVSATLIEGYSLTRPLLTFDRYSKYAVNTYSFIKLENFLGDDAKCKNEYNDYYITVMPDRAAANNPLVRINFGRARIEDRTVHAWKDRSRQDKYETHKFAKQNNPELFLSNNNDYDLTSVVEQDTSEINIDELLDIVKEYKVIIENQSALLIKDRKKVALRMARELRPLNKTLEECGFIVRSDSKNLNDYMNAAIDNNLGYNSRCVYVNDKISVRIEYEKYNYEFKYNIELNHWGTYSSSEMYITKQLVLDIDSFKPHLEKATQVANLITEMNQI